MANNATNNNTLMYELQSRLLNFRGHACRVWYYAHTLNLIAKATLHQFEIRKKKKRQIDNDAIPSFDDLPLLLPIEDLEDKADNDNALADLKDLPELLNMLDGGERKKEDEVENCQCVPGTDRGWRAVEEGGKASLLGVKDLLNVCALFGKGLRISVRPKK